jgi:hypothetical protein
MIASQVYHQTGEDTGSMSRIGLGALCVGRSGCPARSILRSKAAARSVFRHRILHIVSDFVWFIFALSYLLLKSELLVPIEPSEFQPLGKTGSRSKEAVLTVF